MAAAGALQSGRSVPERGHLSRVGDQFDLSGAFPPHREVFHKIDETLKQNLSKLMREGPESDLVLTEMKNDELLNLVALDLGAAMKEG